MFFMLLFNINDMKAQQGVAVTAIFQRNICQIYYNKGQSPVKIEFQIAGLSDEAAQIFSTNALKNEKVINSNISTTLTYGLRSGKLEITAQADFDYIKNIFIENHVAFVKVEDEIYSIDNWEPLTEEQCTKVTLLNQHIYDIEHKRNWILNNPEEKAKAEQNGWFIQNDKYLDEAIKAKKEYLQSIN